MGALKTCVCAADVNENIDRRGSKISFRRSTGKHPSSKWQSPGGGGGGGGLGGGRKHQLPASFSADHL